MVTIRKWKRLLLFCLICWSIVGQAATVSSNEGKEQKGSRLLSRIDFGNSYIMGQTIKSGAVYLMQRKRSEIKSMLDQRSNYRKEILENFVINSSMASPGQGEKTSKNMN